MATERVTMVLDEHRSVSVIAETRYRGTDTQGGGSTELSDVTYRGVTMGGTWDGCATHHTIVDMITDAPLMEHLGKLHKQRKEAQARRDELAHLRAEARFYG